jgi:hypothetical protein
LCRAKKTDPRNDPYNYQSYAQFQKEESSIAEEAVYGIKDQFREPFMVDPGMIWGCE